MKKAKRLKLISRPVPWPMRGDQLFKADSDWRHNAHLDLSGKGWGAYAVGYKEAADSLARRFLKNWQGNDTLTYPMVFLYRQYLELRLKEVIMLGQKLLDEPLDIQKKIIGSHSLEDLWKPCREILEILGKSGLWPEDSVEQLDSVEVLVMEFHGKDPKATNFRYPVTKASEGGQPTLPFLNRVGVRNFYKVMQRLDSFFTGQIDGIDYHLHAS
jgi:hypothetical protein